MNIIPWTLMALALIANFSAESKGRHVHQLRFSPMNLEKNSENSYSLAILTLDNPLGTFTPSHHDDSKHKGSRSKGLRKNLEEERYPKLYLGFMNNTTRNYDDDTKHKSHHDKKKFSWRRSKKTRRHEKANSFHSHHRHFSQQIEREKEPFFDTSSPSIVTAQLGSHAFLTCRIHDLEDKSVSWIRNKDAHILTVDRYTFISDSRFVSWFDPDSETWTLQVKFTKPEDAGRYECQISTEPKRSHFVTLAVVVPLVVIPGGSELHVRSGSDVMLKCVISKALIPPPYVFWYHEDKRVPEGQNLGGLVYQSPLMKVTMDSSVASLNIKSAEHRHAGNYTCAPAGLTTSASILLHVLNGEHPAAMQHGSNGAPTQVLASSTLNCILILQLILCFCIDS